MPRQSSKHFRKVITPAGNHYHERVEPGHSVRLYQQSGLSYWVTSKQARGLIKDNLVIVRQVEPLIVVELPAIRLAWSTLYVDDRYSTAMRLYREALISTLRWFHCGTPPQAYRPAPQLDPGYVPMPRGKP